MPGVRRESLGIKVTPAPVRSVAEIIRGLGPEPTDQELGEMARKYWGEATSPGDGLGARDVWHVPEDFWGGLQDAVDFAADRSYRFRDIRRALAEYIDAKKPLRPPRHGRVRLASRLHATIWRMAQALDDYSTYDASRSCAGSCDRPATAPPTWHCPRQHDTAREECARSVVFPYQRDALDEHGQLTGEMNRDKVAAAITRGFAVAGLPQLPQRGNDRGGARRGTTREQAAIRTEIARRLRER